MGQKRGRDTDGCSPSDAFVHEVCLQAKLTEQVVMDWFKKIEDEAERAWLPPGLSARLCLVPEEVQLDRFSSDLPAVKQALARHFGGFWPPWPTTHKAGVPGRSQRWSVATACLSDDPGTLTVLVGLKIGQDRGLAGMSMHAYLLGFTHARDLRLATEAISLPRGSRESFSSGEEVVSRLLVERRLLDAHERSASETLDYIFMDSDAGDVDPRPTMHNLPSQAMDDWGDDFAGDDASSAGGSSSSSSRPAAPVESTWEHCKNEWRKMGRISAAGGQSDFRGQGWFYLPAPLGEGRLPMLLDESCQTNMFALTERISKRLTFLWKLEEWVTCPDRKADDVFVGAMRFDSLEHFVLDRYACELVMLAASIRQDWVERLARAEGLLACIYFGWLGNADDRLRMLRANEVCSKAFEGQSSRTFYRRLCGGNGAFGRSRGRTAETVAQNLCEYVNRNVLQRCATWRRLLRVDPDTGLAAALSDTELGPTLGPLLGELWRTIDELNERNPLNADEILDETTQLPDSPPLDDADGDDDAVAGIDDLINNLE